MFDVASDDRSHLPTQEWKAADIHAAKIDHLLTNGNFRLIQRLFTQITRIRDINQLDTITNQVVEAARETLLIGT